MFYPVNVLDSKNKLIEVISSKQLSTRHWKVFNNKHSNFNLKKAEKPQKKRQK
jgi:hypothetical protein